MLGNLENLKFLKQDMINKGWSICSFLFRYKEVEYIVLVKRFVGIEKKVAETWKEKESYSCEKIISTDEGIYIGEYIDVNNGRIVKYDLTV